MPEIYNQPSALSGQSLCQQGYTRVIIRYEKNNNARVCQTQQHARGNDGHDHFMDCCKCDRVPLQQMRMARVNVK